MPGCARKPGPFRNHEKTFFNGCSETLTEGIVLYSPFLLQIDTLGKWLRCLTNVCFAKLKKKLKISEQTQIIWVSSSPCLCAINVGPSSCWVPENSTFHLYKIELKGSTVTECGAQRSPSFAHLESSLAPRSKRYCMWILKFSFTHFVTDCDMSLTAFLSELQQQVS